VQIAAEATERQIGGGGRSAVLFSDDLVDRESVKKIVNLACATIFAAISSPDAHELSERFCHQPRDLEANKARALDLTMATKVPADA
jgi:hypothetical protein